jgi:hypothetical protein
VTPLTVDEDQRPDVAVSVEAARAAAARLGLAAGAAEEAGLELAGAVTPSWVGSGNQEWTEARGRVGARLDAVAGIATAAARVIVGYAAAMDDVRGQVRLANTELAEARAGRRLAMASGGGVPAVWMETAMAAIARHDRAIAAYQEAVASAAGALERLRDDVADRPLSLGDQAGDFGVGLWEGAVSGPVKGLWELASGPFTDRDAWWAMVSGTPGAIWDSALHPGATAAGLLGVAEFRAGRWGAGAAIAASSFVPSKRLKVFASAQERSRFARNMADPHAPRPRVQTVDEMVAGVNLARHEHHDLGHAIRRHVDVDDDYLRDRLTNGTLDDGASRGHRPHRASAWDDLATAERSVTQALAANEAMVRSMARGTEPLQSIVFPLEQPAGRVMSTGPSGFSVHPAQTVVVTFKRDGNSLFIETAYLK